MTDGTARTDYTYDAADRITQVQQRIPPSWPTPTTVSYGYDDANRRTSLTYPSGRVVSYAYDTVGQLSSVTPGAGIGATTYAYDAAGRLTTTTRPNGTSTTQAYDLAGRNTSIEHTSGMTTTLGLTCAYNAAGNLTGVVDSVAGTTTYTYDALDRLTQETLGAQTTTYTYDAVGNRLTKGGTGGSTAYAYDDADRLTTVSGGTSGTYSYDARGNQLVGLGGPNGAVNYVYDALDRLTGISGGTTASYTYNGDGLRLEATVGGTTTTSVWDLANKTPDLLSDGTNDFVYGQGLLGQFAASQVYAHADHLGSVRLTTDATGATVATALYDAFGLKTSQSGAQPKLGFTGEQQDAESLLIYLRARYLDPASGRFLSVDPAVNCLSARGRVSAYSYVDNNPQRWVDPSGRCKVQLGYFPAIGHWSFVAQAETGVLPVHLVVRTRDRDGGMTYYEGLAENPDEIFSGDPGSLLVQSGSGSAFGPGGDWETILDTGGESCERLDGILSYRTQWIQSLGLHYDVDGPNSNSVAYSLVQAVGVRPSGNVNGYFGEWWEFWRPTIYAPGWGPGNIPGLPGAGGI